MNKNRQEQLNDFLCDIGTEVLKESGILEDKIEDEQILKKVEKFAKEEFSDGLVKISPRTAGWILRLFNNKAGKTIIKILICRQFKKAIVEQLKEAGNFLEGVKESLEEREKILHEWKSVLTENLDQIEREIYKKEKSKKTIH